MKRFNFKITEEVYDWIWKKSYEEKVSRSEFVRRKLEEAKEREE